MALEITGFFTLGGNFWQLSNGSNRPHSIAQSLRWPEKAAKLTFEEMAEDRLDFIDVETAILNGRLIKIEKDDPRGTRYTVHGIGADSGTPVGTIGRFKETGRYLIVTVYEVTEPEI